jgi:hypothetical protein
METSAAGCTGNASINVTINTLPSIYIAGNLTVCANSTNTYSTTTGSGVSDLWTVTGGTIIGSSTGNSVQVTWGNSSMGTITLQQTGSNYTNTLTDTVTINPLPDATITGPGSVCANSTATYSVPSASGATYSWTIVGGTINGTSRICA